MPDTSFKRFPKDVEKQNYWIKNMKINRTLARPAKLFWKNEERWFYYTKNSHYRRRLLLREAVPFIFPHAPTNLQIKKSNKGPDSVPSQNFKTECKTSIKDNENTVSTSTSEVRERESISVVHSKPSTSDLKTFCTKNVKPIDKYQVFLMHQSNAENKDTIQDLITNQNAASTSEEEPSKSSSKPSIDEYEALGISWVAQLRKLTESQKVLATGLINQVLQKGYFQDLTKNTRINDTSTSDLLSNSPPTTISFPSSPSPYYTEGESNPNATVTENHSTEEEITMDTEIVVLDTPERVFITCSKDSTT